MFAALQSPPEGVPHAEAMLNGLDACFLNGFARLGDAEAASLASLATTFTGTPLSAPVSAAAEALAAGDYTIEHFKALAAARGALQGAIHDALVKQVRAALGRADAPPAATAAGAPLPEHTAPLLESTQQWLMELALAGFGQLDYGTVVPFAATLEKLQSEPSLGRLSVLLTGALGEIAAALPIEDAAALPLSRWVDLWSRAMLGSLGAPSAPAAEPVDGSMKILGAALNTHSNAATVTAWGLLEGGGKSQLVRISRSAWKVDQVFDASVWQALGDAGDPLMRAIGERRILRVSGGSLLSSGDLVLEAAKTAESMAPFDWAAAAPLLAPGEALDGPVAAPADRHPVQIAEPVYLDDFEASSARKGDQTVTVGGASLPVDADRMGYRGQHLNAVLSNASRVFGLLRYDGGGWRFQPLALQTHLKGSKVVDYYNGDDAMAAIKNAGSSNLGILRERAGKILRAKS